PQDPPTSVQTENPSDLERSIVIARLPIDPNLDDEAQVRQDYDQVVAITTLIGYPVLPVTVYRMPVANPSAAHNRLTKVLLPTRKHAELILKFASRVKRDPHFSDIFIRPSYAKPEERPKTPPTSRRPFLHQPPHPHPPQPLMKVQIGRLHVVVDLEDEAASSYGRLRLLRLLCRKREREIKDHSNSPLDFPHPPRPRPHQSRVHPTTWLMPPFFTFILRQMFAPVSPCAFSAFLPC
ncbi:hypothetical protein PFISCL1PPCAC_22952, partial [Pristionchus fissidentatus]